MKTNDTQKEVAQEEVAQEEIVVVNESKKLSKSKIRKLEKKRAKRIDADITSVELNQLLDQAFIEDKKVFVRFSAKWCLPCKMMEKNIYSDPAIRDLINSNYLELKIDIESLDGINLKQLLDVHQVPTLVIIDENFRVKDRRDTSISYHQMIDFLNDNLERGLFSTVEDQDSDSNRYDENEISPP